MFRIFKENKTVLKLSHGMYTVSSVFCQGNNGDWNPPFIHLIFPGHFRTKIFIEKSHQIWDNTQRILHIFHITMYMRLQAES